MPAAASFSAASPITRTASCGRAASASKSCASARASANLGVTFQTSLQSNSRSATDVREDAEIKTVRPSNRPLAEQRYTPHRPVTGDGELGQEHQLLGVAGVLDGADHAHIELA